ncbi:MAG: response regulator [Oligoflexus sp.]|jgi:CheY-like chemotaxis protein
MGKVLLVDDTPDFLDVLKKSLEAAGFEVATVGSGLEALAYIRGHAKQVDCVLADYMMPEMRGDELASIIKHKTGIPVIIMTGDTNLSLEQLFKCGISGILNKPFDSKDFIEFLKNNDLHIENEQLKQRKFLRRMPHGIPPKIWVTNGRQALWGEIVNLSSGGVGLSLPSVIRPISTLEFKMEKDGEEVGGFMHCRWESRVGEQIRAGFEFDSLTKKSLANKECFARWITISKDEPA